MEPQIDIDTLVHPYLPAYDDISALIQLSFHQSYAARFAGLLTDGAEAHLPLHHGEAKVDFESREGRPLETLSELQMILVHATVEYFGVGIILGIDKQETGASIGIEGQA